MKISVELLTTAYALFLGRSPSLKEIATLQETHSTLADVRRTFLYSKEFRLRYRELMQDVSPQAGRKLVHLHIPKTAGSSLNQLLAKSFRPNERLETNAEKVRRLLAEKPDAIEPFRLIHGHLNYGLHESIAAKTTYLCLLRKPIPRLLSFYSFIMRRPSHPYHTRLTSRNVTFGGFLRLAVDDPTLRGEIDNGQIRRLAGPILAGPFGREAETFEAAKAHLFGGNVLFGLTEHFSFYVQRLVAEGVLVSSEIATDNVNPAPMRAAQSLEALNDEEQFLLRAFTYWDDQLYHLAHQRFFGLGEVASDIPIQNVNAARVADGVC